MKAIRGLMIVFTAVVLFGVPYLSADPGVITVDGDYTQGPNGTLDIEIVGTAGAGKVGGHDQLAATKTASLDGTLKMQNVGGFDPAVGSSDGVNGDEFIIITAPDGVSGTFSQLIGNHMGSGKFYEVVYNVGDVTLGAFQARTGDADGDKDIDITDFNFLAVNFNPDSTTSGWQDGNFDDDGDIDITDFNFLATNFNPDGYSGLTSVPEPAAFGLLLCGLTYLAYVTSVRRRR